ncbi:MAG: hypothetical protein MHM6MM_008838 [Cercozoa sp. M6MM]
MSQENEKPLAVLHQAFRWIDLAPLSDKALFYRVKRHLCKCLTKIRKRRLPAPDLITANELPSSALRALPVGEKLWLDKHKYEVAVCSRLPGCLYTAEDLYRTYESHKNKRNKNKRNKNKKRNENKRNENKRKENKKKPKRYVLPGGKNVKKKIWDKEMKINKELEELDTRAYPYKGNCIFEVALVLFKVDGRVLRPPQLANELNPKRSDLWKLCGLRFKFQVDRQVDVVAAVVHTRPNDVPRLLFEAFGGGEKPKSLGLFESLSLPQDAEGSVHVAVGNFNFNMHPPMYECGQPPGKQQIDRNKKGQPGRFPPKGRGYPHGRKFLLSKPHDSRGNPTASWGVKVSSFKRQFASEKWETRDTMVHSVRTPVLRQRRFYSVALLPRRESGGTTDHMFLHAESTVLHKVSSRIRNDHHPVYHQLYFRLPPEAETQASAVSTLTDATTLSNENAENATVTEGTNNSATADVSSKVSTVEPEESSGLDSESGEEDSETASESEEDDSETVSESDSVSNED